jgi:hypothetical protein
MIEYGIVELSWWQAILAVIVTVVGSARLTRILTHDDYPPSIAIRVWWQGLTKDGAWAKLVTCPWCAGPWITLIAVASFIVSFLHPALGWAWWLFWGWLTLSYWTSQYVHFDEGRGEQ